MRLFLEAEEDARAAVAVDSENAEAHFVVAVTLGRVSLRMRNRQSD